MMPVQNMCTECAHFDEDAQFDEGVNRCRAFPDGIPPEIWVEGHDHREPVPGDRDVRFEPREDANFDHIDRFGAV